MSPVGSGGPEMCAVALSLASVAVTVRDRPFRPSWFPEVAGTDWPRLDGCACVLLALFRTIAPWSPLSVGFSDSSSIVGCTDDDWA